MNVILALWYRGLKTFVRNKAQFVFTIIMPFFFLYVFSSIFKVQNINDPVNYMLAGIVITNVFQVSLSISSSTITDIVSGFMKEVLVSPVKRSQIAIGQILTATTIGVLQGMLIIAIGFFIGLKFTSIFTPIAVIGVMALVGVTFSAFGLFLATLVKNAQTFQVMEMAITMPLVFLSGAYIPLSSLPDALRIVAYFNPLTYTTAFFRTVILEKTSLSSEQLIAEQLAFEIKGFVITPWISMLMVVSIGVLFLILSTIVFSKVDFSKINRTKASDSDIWA